MRIIKIYKRRITTKVFCIGLNKTGTTTLEHTLEQHGFKMGNQTKASVFLSDWKNRDFHGIIEYCRNADAFQDFPFSFPYTYIALDQAFPESKFILTVRNSAKQWHNSITTFHGKLWANCKIPNKKDLQNAFRYTKGRPWEVNRAIFNSPENDPYNYDSLSQTYENHIRDVKEYFRHRPNDLIVINVEKDNDYLSLCNFLNIKPLYTKFPWKNKT